MNAEMLNSALALARRTWRVLIGTCSTDCVPHLATAGRMSRSATGDLAVSEWFCPGTVANLRDGCSVALAAWDPATDEGYQVLGTVLRVEDSAILDGYEPGLHLPDVPQVRRTLIIQPTKVTRFIQAPHSDVEEPAPAY